MDRVYPEMGSLLKFGEYGSFVLLLGFFVVIAWKVITGEISLDGLLDSVDGRGNRSFSVERAQLLIFTLLVAAKYVLAVIHNPRRDSLPDLPTELVVVLAGSQAIYIGAKARSILVPVLKERRSITKSAEVQQFGRTVERVIAGPKLDNYSGYLCAVIQSAGDSRQLDSSNKNEAFPSEALVLDVWLDAAKPESGLCDQVRIIDGEQSPTVKFRLRPDSDAMSFQPSVQDLDVGPQKPSQKIRFTFSAPAESGEYTAWLQLLQKNRLIQVLPVSVQVRG